MVIRALLLLVLILFALPVSSSSIDPKEANVMKIEYEVNEGTEYRFDVTLFHDDDGESPNYADSWQVETLNGTILGTRILTHAHGTIEFTRSADIIIPDNADELVIRGHDQNHGFGGQVGLIKMSTNEMIYIDQGDSLMDFSEYQFNSTGSDLLSNENATDFGFLPISSILLSSIIYKRRK